MRTDGTRFIAKMSFALLVGLGAANRAAAQDAAAAYPKMVTTNSTAAEPTGNPNFNAQNIESSTGQFWGVMGLTLAPNGYAWDFESALKDPAQPSGPPSFSDKGFATCHGRPSGRGY